MGINKRTFGGQRVFIRFIIGVITLAVLAFGGFYGYKAYQSWLDREEAKKATNEFINALNQRDVDKMLECCYLSDETQFLIDATVKDRATALTILLKSVPVDLKIKHSIKSVTIENDIASVNLFITLETKKSTESKDYTLTLVRDKSTRKWRTDLLKTVAGIMSKQDIN